MTLGELTKVFSNNTEIQIELLVGMKADNIYKGSIYGYSNVLNDTWPNNDFKNFDVTNVEVVDNVLKVLIES